MLNLNSASTKKQCGVLYIDFFTIRACDCECNAFRFLKINAARTWERTIDVETTGNNVRRSKSKEGCVCFCFFFFW